MLQRLLEKQKDNFGRYLTLLHRTAVALERNDLETFGELAEAHGGLAERLSCYDGAIAGWLRSTVPTPREGQALDDLRRLRRRCVDESAGLPKLLRKSMTTVRRQIDAARRHLAGRPAGHVEPTMIDISR